MLVEIHFKMEAPDGTAFLVAEDMRRMAQRYVDSAIVRLSYSQKPGVVWLVEVRPETSPVLARGDQVHKFWGIDEDGWVLFACRNATPRHPLSCLVTNGEATCKVCLSMKEVTTRVADEST